MARLEEENRDFLAALEDAMEQYKLQVRPARRGAGGFPEEGKGSLFLDEIGQGARGRGDAGEGRAGQGGRRGEPAGCGTPDPRVAGSGCSRLPLVAATGMDVEDARGWGGERLSPASASVWGG